MLTRTFRFAWLHIPDCCRRPNIISRRRLCFIQRMSPRVSRLRLHPRGRTVIPDPLIRHPRLFKVQNLKRRLPRSMQATAITVIRWPLPALLQVFNREACLNGSRRLPTQYIPRQAYPQRTRHFRTPAHLPVSVCRRRSSCNLSMPVFEKWLDLLSS